VRRGLAWLSAAPLILGGSQLAHVLAYRLVYPDSQLRLHALVATGHGYMQELPFILGVAAAVGLVSLVSTVGQAARGRSPQGIPPIAFALLPLAAFTLQEILERSLHTGTFVWQAVESPTFLPGLALQLPFAVLAFLAARLLLQAAERVGRRFVARPVVRRIHLRRVAPALVEALPRRRPLACSLAKRGPPLLSA
jgi:hypothetical protein